MSDSEDDVPLARRRATSNGASAAAKPTPKPAPKRTTPARSDATRPRAAKRPATPVDDSDEDDDEKDSPASSDSEDSGGSDVPLSQRRSKKPASQKKPASNGAARASRAKPEGGGKAAKRGAKEDAKKMWTTLQHAGVLFPPEYEPHGVKMLYDGKPVDLTPEQEEVASMYAVMLETPYMTKPTFTKNFWEGFKEILQPKHVIKELGKCDFRPIFDHFQALSEKKKSTTKEV